MLQVGSGQGVLIERCRYLEEAGCASICINSCKVPTQVRWTRGHSRAPWSVCLCVCMCCVCARARLCVRNCQGRGAPDPPPASLHATRTQPLACPAPSNGSRPAYPCVPPPFQNFFVRDMGLPLTITPNYDDFSCQ